MHLISITLQEIGAKLAQCNANNMNSLFTLQTLGFSGDLMSFKKTSPCRQTGHSVSLIVTSQPKNK